MPALRLQAIALRPPRPGSARKSPLSRRERGTGGEDPGTGGEDPGTGGEDPGAGGKDLWTCPKCGAKLVSRNLWHSCGLATLDDWKARMGPRARALYARFEGMIAACGEYHVAPAKTRIAFLARVRFAGITSISERGMTCAFSLPRPRRSRRFMKVEEVAPGWWVHRLRITDPDQLDQKVQAWIRESYRLMGLQERLA